MIQPGEEENHNTHGFSRGAIHGHRPIEVGKKPHWFDISDRSNPKKVSTIINILLNIRHFLLNNYEIVACILPIATFWYPGALDRDRLVIILATALSCWFFRKMLKINP